MIPAGAFTAAPVPSTFQVPYNRPYTALAQTVLGGNAIGDASSGRQVKEWTATRNGSMIDISPAAGIAVLSVPASGALTVSLAFDSNMAVVLTWATATDLKLYYYDSTLGSYTTRTFSGDSSRVCVDDARDFYAGQSDVIFAYTNAGNLYYRQQRDRYDVQYLIGATTKKLRQVAPSSGGRLQFELR